MHGISKALIEVSMWSRSKYEMDKETGLLVLDREIERSYPTNYGYIPNTLSPDGDALDIFVISNYPIEPGVIVRYEPLGVVQLLDQGVSDNKVIAKLPGFTSPHFELVQDIVKFLSLYKEGTKVLDLVLNEADAVLEITKAHYRHLRSPNGHNE